MALTIEFEPTGAAAGLFTVAGLPAEVGAEVLAAVQRTDDGRWLTLHGLWSAEVSWFPCPRVTGSAGEDRFAVEPNLGAGLRAAAGIELRAHLRRFEFADAGALRLRGLEAPARPAPASAPGPSDRPDPVPVGAPAAPTETSPTRPDTDWDPLAGTFPRRALWPIAGGTLALAGGALVWYLLTIGSKPVDTPGAASAPGPATGPTQTARPTGKALAAYLRTQGLNPADKLRAAETALQAQDCDAAIGLFVDAAKTAAPLAERLAKRYDPEGFTPSPCFSAPQPDSALVWYQRAAEQGLPSAQRRYGELLLTETDAGPVYREAIDWLHRAAAAGDEAAARRLTALGER